MKRKVFIKSIPCKFPGCSNKFVPYRKTHKYCSNHTKGQIRYSKIIKTLKKPSKIALKKAELTNKIDSYERARKKAIAMSPNIDNLLWFTPDGGKTLIYCKNEKQLKKAKKLFERIYSWKHTLPKE